MAEDEAWSDLAGVAPHQVPGNDPGVLGVDMSLAHDGSTVHLTWCEADRSARVRHVVDGTTCLDIVREGVHRLSIWSVVRGEIVIESRHGNDWHGRVTLVVRDRFGYSGSVIAG